jgi:hypothetical protein
MGEQQRSLPAYGTQYQSKAARNEAVVGSFVEGLRGQVNQKKKDQQQALVTRAQILFETITAYGASGKPEDQAKAKEMLNDPKNLKILEKGLNYVPAEAEAPPPEHTGITKAIQAIKAKLSGQQAPAQQQAPPKPTNYQLPPVTMSPMDQAKIQHEQAGTAQELATAEARRAEAANYKDDATYRSKMLDYTAEKDKLDREYNIAKEKRDAAGIAKTQALEEKRINLEVSKTDLERARFNATLGGAETPKERHDVVSNWIKETSGEKATADKTFSNAMSEYWKQKGKVTIWNGNQDNIDEAKKAVESAKADQAKATKKAQTVAQIGPLFTGGKITKEQATTAVYGAAPKARAWAPPAGAPSAKGQKDGAGLQGPDGKIAAIAKDGQWTEPTN